MRKKNDGKGRLGGRSAGTSNRVTGEMRNWVQELINQNREALEADLKALEPRERWQVVERLMSYCIPKQSTIEADVSFSTLTNEQIDYLVNELADQILNDPE